MPAIGQIPIAPAVTAPIPLGIVAATSLAALTQGQQDSILRGTIVATTTQSLVYTGYGDKTSAANYIDIVPSVTSQIATHEADTTAVHGVVDTAKLASTSQVIALSVALG